MARMTPRHWAAICFVSLALNVLMAGVIGTAYVNRELRDRELVHRMTVYTVPWAFRIIGEEVGPAARRVYAKNQAELVRDRKTLAADYAAVNAILDAEQFDRAAFVQALGKLRTDVGSAQGVMHEAMSEFASELSRDQRRQLSQFVSDWSMTREQRAIRRDELIEQKERRESKAN